MATFTSPTNCRLCGGTMQVGTLTTSRETYHTAHAVRMDRLSSAELWFMLGYNQKQEVVLAIPPDGPYMVYHYRCAECGYLESYAHGKYPSK